MIRRGVLATSCAAGAALVLVLSGAGAASADSGGATIVSGTGTIFMSKAYIANMAANNIVITAQNPISVDSTPPTFTITTWATDGGDANLKACTGTVDLNGGSLLTNTATGKQLLLSDIRFDVANDSIDYTLTTPAGPKTIVGMNLDGIQGGFVKGTQGTYAATELFINRTSAAALDSDLGTNAFEDTDVFGAFVTTFTLSQPNSPSGLATCG